MARKSRYWMKEYSWKATFTDESFDFDKVAFKKTLDEKLYEFSKTLNPRELYIFKNRMRSEAPVTLKNIGIVYEVCRERIREIKVRIDRRLRHFLSKAGICEV